MTSAMLTEAVRYVLPFPALLCVAGCFGRSFQKIPTHGTETRPWFSFICLTLYLMLLSVPVCLSERSETPILMLAFILLGTGEWVCFLLFSRSGMRAEMIGFYLSSLGLAVAAAKGTGAVVTQLVCYGLGIAGFYALRLVVKNRRVFTALRIPAALFTLGVLTVCLLLAETMNGAKNWITVRGVNFQPSELAKVSYIVAAAPVETKKPMRELIFFSGFSALCVLLLAAMNDFGTAAVYFCGFIAMACFRVKGYWAAGAGLVGAAGAGAVLFRLSDHAAKRFSTWRHIWEDPNNAGYQQTRTLAAAAGGGLLGLGAGKGWLRNVFAFQTDMVFGYLCEEFGWIVAGSAVLMLLGCAVTVLRNSVGDRNRSLLACAGCACMFFLVQGILNVLGSTDILPFTGVTFPFVSRGGTSALVCWCMLAFLGTDARFHDAGGGTK